MTPNITLTKDGEHWDQIALRAYGAERHLSWLMRHNLPLTHIYRFERGVEVNTPPMPQESRNLPPFRR